MPVPRRALEHTSPKPHPLVSPARRWNACFAAALAVSLSCALASPSSAQYFGRSKVQYERFDFKVLKTEHFDVYYYEEEKAAAERAARIAERWHARLSQVLDHKLSRRQPLILYASHPHFEQTNAIPGEIGEGTGGVTEFLKRRIVLPLAGSLAETDHVIGHELVHAFQFDITGESRSGAGFAAPVALRLPLWFIEGMAEYLSVGPVDAHTAMWMRDAARANKLPTISKLQDSRFFPYRYGQALFSYIGGRWGDDAVGRILKTAGRTADAERAIRSVTGQGPDTLSREWHQAVRDWYATTGVAPTAATGLGRKLIAGSREGRRLNVAPSLSPDGQQLVYFSERNLFSIEMFLADVQSGRILETITRAATDPHLQSLQFIHSAGSWSHDGRRFAYASIRKGRPALVIYDMRARRTERELELGELDEIFNPTWSPDGRRVAFTAMTGGVTDLFVVDLQSRHLERLTDDPYAALAPAWSPDGRRIAFVTDRFATDLEALSYDGYQIALIDPATREVTQVPGFAAGVKHINPQWTPDGSSLHFIADPAGISNVYRVELASGAITQVTQVATGVSGITALSPALSAARNAERMVVTVYEEGGYSIYAIDSTTALAGAPPSVPASALPAGPAQLPPAQRTGAEVGALVANPSFGLADRASFRPAPYRASLSLDNVSQANLGIGTGGGSVVGGGGATLYWSDILGDHNLVTLLQVNNAGGSFLNNVAAGVGYYNLRQRWNWGVLGSQFPTITQEFLIETGTLAGEPVVRERDFRRFQIDRELQLQLAYPFSRAQRIEFAGGLRSIDFSGEVEERIFSQITGELLAESITSLADDSIPSINLGVASAALVYDNSYFGGTSPLLGRRYRLEVSPTFGDLNYLGVLGDVRQYLPLARPLTLASRVLHYGRYGSDGEDPRLSDLFLGYPSLVRGYDNESFTPAECGNTVDGSCPPFDRLLGSRIAVGNVELRLPLLGGAGLVPGGGIPPIEAAAFLDAGAAWREGESFQVSGRDRRVVTSHGVALRVNLLGFAVAEIDLVHPNDRPDKGWYWLFSLQPGF